MGILKKMWESWLLEFKKVSEVRERTGEGLTLLNPPSLSCALFSGVESASFNLPRRSLSHLAALLLVESSSSCSS